MSFLNLFFRKFLNFLLYKLCCIKKSDEDINQFENIEDNVNLFKIQEVDQSIIIIIINELNTIYSKDIYNLDTAFKKNNNKKKEVF